MKRGFILPSDRPKPDLMSFVKQSQRGYGNGYGRRVTEPDAEGMRTGALLRIAEAVERQLEHQQVVFAHTVPIYQGATFPGWRKQVLGWWFAGTVATRWIQHHERLRGKALSGDWHYRVRNWISDRIARGYRLTLPAPPTVFKKSGPVRAAYRKWLALPMKESTGSPAKARD